MLFLIGHHSKYVNLKAAKEKFYVITNPEQIWPLAVLNCGVDQDAGPSSRGERERHLNPEQEREAINREMAKIFEKQLKMHLTGKYMRPCPAIITKLYPHQMFALAWMAERENTLRRGEVKGGILADDMGLGKTLTILSLLMTNCHDNRPLAKPMPGQKRKFTSKTLRYLLTRVDYLLICQQELGNDFRK